MSERGVLEDDPRLPHLGVLRESSRLLEVLNARILPRLGFAAAAVSASLDHLNYRPGRQCFALLRIELDGISEPLRLVASFAKDDRLKQAFRRRYSRKSALGRAVFLEDLNLLAERFPFDWQLPVVSRLLEPRGLAGLLEAAGLSNETDEVEAAVRSASVEMYRPHEAFVVRYEGMQLPHEGRAGAVAKAVRDRHKMAAFQRSSEGLRSAIQDPKVWVPATYRPLGQPAVLFMELARGESVRALVGTPRAEEAERAIELSATALREIHRAPRDLAPRKRRGLSDVWEHALGRVARAAVVAPDLAERASRVLEVIGPHLPSRPVRSAFLHGDYNAGQMLIEDGRIALLDLDRSRRGDPAIDLGNFLADLRVQAVLTEAAGLRTYEELFISAYMDGRLDGDLLQRARLMKVMALVRMAIHRFRQQAHIYSGEDSGSHLLIGEAEECLAAL